MKISTLLAVAACTVIAGDGLALAQMDGPPPPDGPMQGLMHGYGRLSDRFFSVFDLNHDGKVTRDEISRADSARFASAAHGGGALGQEQFAAMYSEQFRQHTAQMFRRLDWNGDGRLSLEEYAGPQRVRFEIMDRDGRGAESCAPDILQRASFGSRTGRGGFGKARFCADNDANRDGTVTHAEFDSATARRFAALTAGSKSMTQAQFDAEALARYRGISARTFKRLDTNNDGRLSLAEFSASDQKLFARLDRNRDGTVTRDELLFSASRRGGGGRASLRG